MLANNILAMIRTKFYIVPLLIMLMLALEVSGRDLSLRSNRDAAIGDLKALLSDVDTCSCQQIDLAQNPDILTLVMMADAIGDYNCVVSNLRLPMFSTDDTSYQEFFAQTIVIDDAEALVEWYEHNAKFLSDDLCKKIYGVIRGHYWQGQCILALSVNKYDIDSATDR